MRPRWHGHEVKLVSPRFARPFVKADKNDAADAQAIWTVVRKPQMRTVAQKKEEQPTMLSLHRMGALLAKFRTMQVNEVRSLLYEFGATFRRGRAAGFFEICDLEFGLPTNKGAVASNRAGRINQIKGVRARVPGP